MQTDVANRAIGGGAVGLGGWFLSHLAQINLVLQFIILTLSLPAALYGLYGLVPKIRAWWKST